jgi:hypothetical protein
MRSKRRWTAFLKTYSELTAQVLAVVLELTLMFPLASKE